MGIWFRFIIVILVVLIMGASTKALDNKVKIQQQLLTEPEKIPAQIAAGIITLQQIPNPHWDKDSCIACHVKKPDSNGLNLRNNNIDTSCQNCHSVISKHSYIHPTGIKSLTIMNQQMAEGFQNSIKRSDGKLSCNTCHDLSKQCLSEHAQEQRLNPDFLRGGPYHQRTTLCFQCHKKEAFTQLNAHDQVTDRGEIRIKRCGICHRTLDGLTDVPVTREVDFNSNNNLSNMCTVCHLDKPHPGSTLSFGKKNKEPTNHLVTLPKYMKKYFLKKQQDNEILLPLEPGTGKIYCGTCHNPHEVGVLKNLLAAAGADSKQRLRTKDICTQCHDI